MQKWLSRVTFTYFPRSMKCHEYELCNKCGKSFWFQESNVIFCYLVQTIGINSKNKRNGERMTKNKGTVRFLRQRR